MEGYEIDVANIIMIKIYDGVVSTDITLAFLCLLKQFYLEEGVLEITTVGQLMTVHRTVDLGLI